MIIILSLFIWFIVVLTFIVYVREDFNTYVDDSWFFTSLIKYIFQVRIDKMNVQYMVRWKVNFEIELDNGFRFHVHSTSL